MENHSHYKMYSQGSLKHWFTLCKDQVTHFCDEQLNVSQAIKYKQTLNNIIWYIRLVLNSMQMFKVINTFYKYFLYWIAPCFILFSKNLKKIKILLWRLPHTVHNITIYRRYVKLRSNEGKEETTNPESCNRSSRTLYTITTSQHQPLDSGPQTRSLSSFCVGGTCKHPPHYLVFNIDPAKSLANISVSRNKAPESRVLYIGKRLSVLKNLRFY